MKRVVTLTIVILIALGMNVAFGQKVIQISEGTDKIAAAYDMADKGDIIELTTSGGTYLETDKLKIKKALTIRGAKGLAEKPVIETESPDRPFEPTGACTHFGLMNVKVSGAVDDGVVDAKDSTKYAMRVRSMDGPYTLVCENVDFDYFYSTEDPPEGYVVRFDGSAELATEVSFINCTMTRIAKHCLRLDSPTAAPGQVQNLVIENCTFADVGGRGVYANLLNDGVADPAAIAVDHCTFYGVNDDALKINNGVNVEVKNSIFNEIGDAILDADSAEVYTSASVMYCDTLDTDGFSRFVDLTTSDIYAEDPEFADPAAFDFTVSLFFKDIAVGDDEFVVGDLRWDSLNPMTNGEFRMAAGVNQLANAYNYAKAYGKHEIILTSSGGIYHEVDKLKVKMGLTIKAAPGLAEKPVIETESPDRPFEPTGACTHFGLMGVKVTGEVDDGVVDAKDSTKYAMRIRSMDGPYTLICEDVEFDNFYSTEDPPEGYVVRFDGSAELATEVRFSNCTMTRIAKHCLRLDSPTAAPGQAQKLVIENCTFADVGGRGVYANLLNDGVADPAEVSVNHCTFYGVDDDALKINNGMNVEVKNSIFNEIGDAILDADSAEVYTSASVTYCDTLDTDGFSRFLELATSDIYAEDPEFLDPTGFDFTVSDFFKDIAVGDDGLVVGDLRWDTENPVMNDMVMLEAGTDQLARGYSFARAYGLDELILTTSGGIYHETDKMKVKSALTIKAMDGLAEKPVIETDSPDRPFEPTGACTHFGLMGVKVTGMVNDGVIDAKDSTKYAMRVRKMDGPYTLVCDDVEFDNFYSTEDPPEGYVVRFDGSAELATEVRFTNCMMTRIAKHCLRLDSPTAAPGQVENLFIENCTFADVGGRGVYANLLNDGVADPADVYVNHCTFYGVDDDALKINNGVNVEVKNSIFNVIGDAILDADSAEVYTSATVTYCDTLDTDGFSRFLDLTASDIYAEDPEFADPEVFDFTVSDFFASIATGDDGLVVGDLRWAPTTDVADQTSVVPLSYTLHQNYPNPFNPTTTIEYVLAADSKVTLSIYNIIGQKVRTLVDKRQIAGRQIVKWDGNNELGSRVVSGVYLYRIETDAFTKTKKMLLLK